MLTYGIYMPELLIACREWRVCTRRIAAADAAPLDGLTRWIDRLPNRNDRLRCLAALRIV